MARKEAKMSLNSLGKYDLSIDSDTGDLTVETSYDTDIAMSLFTDKRADQSQVSESSKRRGWIGDTVSSTVNYKIGSWNWLLKQERLTNQTVNKAVSYVKDALQWILDRELATRIEVEGSRSGTKDIELLVKIFVEKDLVNKFAVSIWESSIYAT